MWGWITKPFTVAGRAIKKAGGWAKRNWKKVSVLALLGATAFFTFGASLGLTAGWGAKVGALVSKMGLGGKIGNIVAGAITQSGTGALLGGAVGAVTGQGFMQGATAGALTGAVTGGAMGAFQPSAAAGVRPTGTTAPTTATDSAVLESHSMFNAGSRPVASTYGAGAGAAAAAPAGAAAATDVARQTGFGRIWNAVIGSGGVGPILQGVGQGLAAGAAAKERRGEEDRRRSSYDIIMESIKPMEWTRQGNSIMGSVGQ